MYRSERKERFVDRYDVRDTKLTVIALFNSLEPYERLLGKDVSEMNDEELQKTLDTVLAVRTVSKYSKVRYLQKYIQWCATVGYKGVSDSYKRIHTDGTEKMRRQFVSSPLHLKLELDKIYTPVEDKTIDLIYRCYLWLGFMCFPEKEIARLTKDNLNFKAHKLVLDGIPYPIYQESERVFHLLAELNEFTYRHTSPDYEIFRQRFPSDGLMRGIKSDFDVIGTRTKVTTRVKRAARESGGKTQELSYKRMDASGMFYRLYVRECSAQDVEVKSEFYERFASRGIKRSSAIGMACTYAEDYERWKVTFMK